MKKIRIGNDFRFVWVIERNSQAEDLTLATNLVLTIKSMYGDSAIPFTIVDGNKVCVDVDSKNAGNVAKYNLRLTYTIPDDSLSDGFRDCSVDIDAFEIVAKTELAEKVDEFTSTSEIAIGFQGNSAFRVWQLQAGNEGKTYEDYIAFLREPMTEAIHDAEVLAGIWAQQEAAREEAEAARQENTSIAIENAELATLAVDLAKEAANSAATLANDKAVLAQSAATLANTKAGLADAAAILATDKAALADSKATLANEKAALAQSAADNANTKATEFTAAEGLRVTAETGRVTAEGGRATAETGRATAETGRTTAESVRVSAENARNAASNAYNLTVQVPLGSGYYTLATAVAAVVVGLRKKGLTITFEAQAGVWETYQFTGASTATWTTLAQWVKEPNQLNVTELLELPISEVLNVLYAKIQALEAFIKTSQYGNVTADQVDVVRNFNVWGKTNLIIEGTAAPTVVPDFVGQQYINTAAGVTYTAKGISSVADWKQTSN